MRYGKPLVQPVIFSVLPHLNPTAMNQKAITIYCVLDDFLQTVRWKGDTRTRL